LEQAYWKYAKEMELDKYLTLWHASFVGWPKSYPSPSGKDQITNWLTGAASKGLTMKSYELVGRPLR